MGAATTAGLQSACGWEKQRQQKQSLCPIIALVVYHGQKNWTVKRQFSRVFETLPQSLRRYVPEFEYLLYDLSRYSEAEIRGWAILQVGLLLLKYSWQDELEEKFGEIVSLLETLNDTQTAIEFLAAVIQYMLYGSEKISREQLTETVSALFDQKGDTAMPTIAQQLYQEGREEARKVMLPMIRRVIALRFEVDLDRFDEILQPLDLLALERLSEIIFEVKTLPEFEAALDRLIVE